jgi:ammonia channel protein AmtB
VDHESGGVIGLVADVLLCWAVFFVENTLKVDDPVGAIAVHGFNGAWGVLSLGLFADCVCSSILRACVALLRRWALSPGQ